MKSIVASLSLVVAGSMLFAGCTVSADPTGGGGTFVCTADDDPCGVDADCCSDICADDGFCGIPVGGCFEDNSECVTDGDCCSDICADDGFCGLP